MVDMVVHRHQLRDTVSRIVRMLMKAPPLLHSSTATAMATATATAQRSRSRRAG